MQEMIGFTQEALMLVLLLSMPPILVATAIGLILAIIQAATQIQEQTLPQAAKLIAVMATLLVMGGFLGTAMISFGDKMFTSFPAESKRR
jgi:type III secretion protein S